ncbi:aquaglyceroporin Gla [Streptococcus dentiloxodontae]
MNDFLKEAFTSEWILKYITEFIATAILVALGNGAVANVELKGSKGYRSGWLVIGFGYGFAVMMPALMFGDVSGNHINPAFTLGLAVSGLFDWVGVPGYLVAQFLGAILGQALVVWAYKPYYLQTENPDAILGSFSTISAVDDGSDSTENHNAALFNGFVNEFIGTFILIFGALALTKNYFGHSIVSQYVAAGYESEAVSGQLANGALAVAHIGVGFLVAALVISFGGPTGPALNPARDLSPRILHHFLPETVLGESKSDSKWWYAWVPVVAPILAGVAAVALFNILYL